VMPAERLDSYRLVLASEATMAFGSTVGVEASLLGRRTLMVGNSRNQWRGASAVFTGDDVTQLPAALDAFLAAPVDPQWQINAARWTYLYAYRYTYDVPLVRRQGAGVECLPQAFSQRLAKWPMLSHLVEFLVSGAEWVETFPAPATVDPDAASAERAAVRESFAPLAGIASVSTQAATIG
jgi:hypothetical protein